MRGWLITSELVCLDGITSSLVSCWEQQSLTRKMFGLVDVEDASDDDTGCCDNDDGDDTSDDDDTGSGGEWQILTIGCH